MDTLGTVWNRLFNKSKCGKGRGEFRHFMYSGQWQHIFYSLERIGELETLIVENSDVGPEWDEAKLSSFLGGYLKASKEFRVSLKTSREMHELAELSIVGLLA